MIVDEIIDEKEIEVFRKLGAKWNAAAVAQPNILRVCSTIRNRFLPLYYKRTTFLPQIFPHTDGELCRWLVAIGPSNRDYLEHLYVRTDGKKLRALIQEHLAKDPSDRTMVGAKQVKLHGYSAWHITFDWRFRSDEEEGLPVRRRSVVQESEDEDEDEDEAALDEVTARDMGRIRRGLAMWSNAVPRQTNLRRSR